jgi:hypothetical protein
MFYMHKKKQKAQVDKPSIILSVVSILFLLVVALAVYVIQVLAPLHVIVSLLILYVVYRRIKKLYRAYVPQKFVTKTAIVSKRFTRVHKLAISIVVVFAVLWYIIASVIPTDKKVFSEIPLDKQTEIVDEDVEVAAVLLDKLILSGDTFLSNPSLSKKELSFEEISTLKHDWETFYIATIETEQMTDRHRYFPQISLFSNKDTQIKSFVISYSLYIKKFEIFHKVIDKVSSNPAVIKTLNEYSDVLQQRGMYDDVTSRFFASNSILRRNLGYVYYKIMAPKSEESISPNYASLLEVSRGSYHYIYKNMLSHITLRSVVSKNEFDRKAFETWLPIQKTVITDKIGNIHVGDRKEKFITVEQVKEMKKSMNPGDILVYRKNWYASNLGIPGFWTHAGLYTGTLEDMDAYFMEIFPYKGYSSMSELLKVTQPKVYEVYMKEDKKGYTPSVVESQTHGTIIQSFESSGSVDYVAAVRTKLSKQEVLDAVILALSHYGQPYDYAFDLDTKQEIFCSELVYDAYLTNTKSKGVTFPKTVTSGRLIVSPNAIVEKYVAENGKDNAELTFVYFLDASEVTKTAFPANSTEFMTTATRPKYSTLQK